MPALVLFLAQLGCELGLVQDLRVLEIFRLLQKAGHSIDITDPLTGLMGYDGLVFGVR